MLRARKAVAVVLVAALAGSGCSIAFMRDLPSGPPAELPSGLACDHGLGMPLVDLGGGVFSGLFALSTATAYVGCSATGDPETGEGNNCTATGAATIGGLAIGLALFWSAVVGLTRHDRCGTYQRAQRERGGR